jgi:hypothetical protein
MLIAGGGGLPRLEAPLLNSFLHRGDLIVERVLAALFQRGKPAPVIGAAKQFKRRKATGIRVTGDR